MNNILITGAKGQLGNEIRLLENQLKDTRFIFTDLDELDICNPLSLEDFFNNNKIDFIVNCAAYTAVDKAEDEPDKALLINAQAVDNLLKYSAKQGSKLIHISTDYVFDGKAHLPLEEQDETAPQSVYGSTKLQGERYALESNRALIIRTSWLYSSFGNNFVKTMLKLSESRDELSVVYDQVGTPTYAHNLAQAIISILKYSFENPFKTGIYHYSNEGVASWYDFASEVFALRYIDININPVRSSQFPTKANRPAYSLLSKEKIKNDFGITIPHWKEALKMCLEQL